MLEGDYFMQGLISFFIAHVLYIVSFYFWAGFLLTPWMLGLFVFYVVVMGYLILPYTGGLKIPVLAYMGIIMVMGWQGGEIGFSSQSSSALFGACGVLLFMMSDSILAYNKFRNELGHAKYTILGTYFPAQLLLSLSLMP